MPRRAKAYLVSEEIQLSKEQLLTAIEASYDGIYITDGDAKTIMINKSYESISGLKRKKLMHRNMRDLVEDGVISQSGTVMALEMEKTITIEQIFQTGKQAVITSTPIFNQEGQPVMVFTNVRDVTELRTLEKQLESTTELNRLYTNELERLREQVGASKNFIAVDPVTQDTLQIAQRIAALDIPVLLTGERGVGKWDLANYIVSKSKRKKEPFVVINCSKPTELVEVDMFGPRSREEDGILQRRGGLLEQADGGTVFFEAVDELAPELQQRLTDMLRTQQNTWGKRKGGYAGSDLRIIASTSKDLKRLTTENKFREELYYQLNVLSIRVPPLRERRDDILPIVDELIGQLNKRYHMRKQFSAAALDVLYSHDWPGNLQELRSAIEHAMIICPNDTIEPEDLPIAVTKTATPERTRFEGKVDLQQKLNELEYSYIRAAYQKMGTVRAAAQALGMSAATFARRKKQLETLPLSQD